MAITTVDGVIAGMRAPELIRKDGAAMEQIGSYHSFFYTTGRPGAAAAPAPGINGAALTTYAGQVPFTNPVSGNTYLARLAGGASTPGTLLLVDRLWHNSGIVVTTTTAQTITFPGLPARSSDGTANGEGVMIGLEVVTATTNVAANTTMTASYTNQAGTAGKTATVGAVAPAAFPATAVAGTFQPFDLAAGDTGVRSVQSITLAVSLVTGSVSLVAYRVLATVGLSVANVESAVDAVTGGLPRLYDNSVPFLLWLPTATTALTLGAQVIYTQG